MSKDKEKLLFLIIYALFAATSSVSESYPANLIFSILVAYYIKPKTDIGKQNKNDELLQVSISRM